MKSNAATAIRTEAPPQLRLGRATVLHLLPGVPALLGYCGLAAIMVPRGLPNILALMLAVILVEVPVSWAILVRQVRKETGRPFRLSDAFPWRARLPVWQYLVIGVPVVVFSMIMIGGVGPAIDRALLAGPFVWVPEWFAMRAEPELFTTSPRSLVLVIWALTLMSFVLLGGFTQELYFRGFLLPRIAHLGAGAPALNAALFAVFHLIVPWSWPTFFVMTLPWAYLVWWRRSVRIGLFIHVGMLLLQWLLMTLLVFGLVQLPAAP